MARHDYTALDAAILAAIRFDDGVGKLFHHIAWAKAVAAASDAIAAVANEGKRGWNETPAWRIVDRRLQALRKAGLIRYQRKPEGWVLVDGAVREVARA